MPENKIRKKPEPRRPKVPKPKMSLVEKGFVVVCVGAWFALLLWGFSKLAALGYPSFTQDGATIVSIPTSITIVWAWVKLTGRRYDSRTTIRHDGDALAPARVYR